MNLFNKLAHACRGIWMTAKRDFSFKLELIGGLILVFLTWLAWPVSQLEAFIVLTTYGLVIVSELSNTALESALDRLHPEKHESIRLSKDAAAGAVFVAFCLNVAVVLLIFLSRLGVWSG